MYVKTISKQCCGCAGCYAVCPCNAIKMCEDEEGFLYPNIDEKRCVHCGMCQQVCSFAEKKNCTDDSDIQGFAAYCKDELIRKNSSSGGLFSVLAEEIIALNGVVYGVAMSENTVLAEYVRAENKPQLQMMRGSKYFQAVTNKVFAAVKADLEMNRWVLFSGTPCQVNGLTSFLGKGYDNLLCADLICHGVPSPLLWRKYVAEYERQNGSLSGVLFRDKTNGWKSFSIKYLGKDGTEKCVSVSEDVYMDYFLKNYCLRPSCYECNAKTYRTADITLGDFWGAEEVCPELDDDKGLSLVLARTVKGRDFIARISNKCEIQPIDLREAVKYNPAEYRSPEKPAERDTFFDDLRELGVEGVKKKYYKQQKKERILGRIKRKIKKAYHFFVNK